MLLHPTEAVDAFCGIHRDALARIHSILESVVPESFALTADRHFPVDLPGGVLATNVRDGFLCSALSTRNESTLTVFEGPNRSVRIFDPSGRRIRLRKRPVDFKTLVGLRATHPPIQTLFGEDPSAAPYELAILWEPDRSSGTLHSVSVAAVAELDEASLTVIYAESPLPLAVLADSGQAAELEAIEDDFEEFFAEREDTGNDDDSA